jgi:hypothetical protein
MKRTTAGIIAVSAAFPSLALTRADAQTAQDIVGTWTPVSAVSQRGDAKIDNFGSNPSGTMVFGGDGRFVLVFARSDLPKFASNRRASGTPDENRAVVQGSIAPFGADLVEEAGKALVLRIEGGTFPNWAAAEQRRAMAISGDELAYTTPGSAGTAAQVTVRRAK